MGKFGDLRGTPVALFHPWIGIRSVKHLFGNFHHAVDSTGRTAVPKQARQALVRGRSRRVTVLEGFEGCLAVYPTPVFEEILDRLSDAAFENREVRELLRWFSAHGSQVDMDAQGRIQLTTSQRGVAGIESEALFIGAGDHLEIWNPERFGARPNKGDGATLAEGVLSSLSAPSWRRESGSKEANGDSRATDPTG